MKYILLIFTIHLSIHLSAQTSILKIPSSPKQIVVDSKDNVIAHLYRGRVVKITPEGKLSFITDDIRKGKSYPYPSCISMAIDAQDNIYMADLNVIWKMTPDGEINLLTGNPDKSTLLDGPIAAAQFRQIEFIKVDAKGNIYVAEKDDTNKDNKGEYYLIRKISIEGMVTTLANTKDNVDLKTNWIAGMGIDSVDNIYLSDGEGRCIKRYSPSGAVTTLAGLCNKRKFHPVYIQGDIGKAELMAPQDILVNKKGEIIFSDGRLNRIIKIAGKQVATIAGSGVITPPNSSMGGFAEKGYQDGKALTALFDFPLGCDIAIDSKQNIYVIDGGNDCIRKLSADGMVTTIAKMDNK